MKFFMLWLFFFICGNFVSAQNVKIDSLKKVLNTYAESDSNYLNTLNEISLEYRRHSHDTMLILAEKGYFLSQKAKFEKGQADALRNKGIYFWLKGDYSTALEIYLKALKIAEKINYLKCLGGLHNNLSGIYIYQNKLDKALEHSLISLEIRKKIGDPRYVEIMSNIAYIYHKQGKLAASLEKNFETLKIRTEQNEKYGIAASLMSIAAVYFDQKKYADAEEFYLKSLAVSEEVKSIHEISYCKKGLADVYWAIKQYEKAAKFAQEALEIANSLDDKVQIRDINDILSKIYEDTGNASKALFHHKQFKIFSDTLVNLEIEKKTATMQIQHEFDKKTAVMEAEQEKERNQFYWIIFSVLAGLLSISVILFLILKSRKKIALAYDKLSLANNEILQKNEEINQQKEEIQQTLEIVSGQKEEIEEKNQDIIASINYALRIQNAIIPKESELKRHLDCFVFFRPRDIVSGDFYWFAEKGSDGLATREDGQNTSNFYILAVADCTGHGVSGAFMTMIGNNILNQIVHDWEIHEPDIILNKMQSLLEKTLSQADGKVADGMDIAVVKIETDKITYAGAMNPLYYVENNELKEIKADKKPIGGAAKENFSYAKHEIPLDKSGKTAFYLCSDGFQDQFGGEKNKKFMTKNLKKLLSDISTSAMSEQKRILEVNFDEWKGNEKQTDDVCIVGFQA